MRRLPTVLRTVSTVAVALACLASSGLGCQRRHLTPPQARGEDLYGRMCAVCHGASGQGYAADQAPALANADFLASVTDPYLRTAIAEGRPGTTMSAWSADRGGPLVHEDVDAVVAFLRTRQVKVPVALDERPAHGDVVRGGDVFARECVKCHGVRGIGGPYIRIGGPELLASGSNGFLRQAVRGGRRGTAMPGFDRQLGEGGVEDVLSLLRSWQTAPAPARTPVGVAPIPLGPVPLHPRGPEPAGFKATPEMTSVDVVKAQLDRGARLGLLDARAPSDYLADHIAGAVSVPFYDPDRYISQLPKDAWLVCYCACPHAESGQLAQKLLSKGFTKVTVLDEGFSVWKSKGFATRVGLDP
jgi:cytochrome c oxidase cbb3-type subunit III